jgi:hypothetical protein
MDARWIVLWIEKRFMGSKYELICIFHCSRSRSRTGVGRRVT